MNSLALCALVVGLMVWWSCRKPKTISTTEWRQRMKKLEGK